LGNGSIISFDLSGSKKYSIYSSAHTYIVNYVQFITNTADRFISASVDGTIKLWEHKTSQKSTITKNVDTKHLWQHDTQRKIDCAKYHNGYIYVTFEDTTHIEKIHVV